jgi:predicted 2-oxoglutarate/Fe(II)-dependent dioxygenase YbiX
VNRDLSTYLLRMDDWINRETCREIIADLTAGNWEKHTYQTEAGDDNPLEEDREFDVGMTGESAATKAMKPLLERAFQFYSTRLQMPWFPAPRYHSPAQFHRYTQGHEMIEHCDHINTLFDGKRRGVPVLTLLALLDDEFSGGELIMWGEEHIPMRAGTIVVFPSNFMFPHRVEPLLDGVRHTAVSWAW